MSYPDVDARERAALNGRACSDDGRVAGISALQVPQELQMVVVRVVRGEPSCTRDWIQMSEP